MKKIIYLSFLLLFLACDNEDNKNQNNQLLSGDNYLIFGHFFGECGGEECVETFKLTKSELYEDTLDHYIAKEFTFVKLSDEKYQIAKGLDLSFPYQLLEETEVTIGQPDAGDWGGLLIKYSNNGNPRYWAVDLKKENVPQYLHKFIDDVRNTILEINK